MKETLEFVIGKNAPEFEKKMFTVPWGCECLGIEHDLPQGYGFLVFLVIRDPKGKVRFQKQLGGSESMISIGLSAKDTTIGGVPGKIPGGCWSMNVCLFFEYVEKFVGEQELPFKIIVSDKRLPVTEVIGGPVWTGNEDVTYSNYEFEKLYQEERRWYKGDLHTHTRLSDGAELPETASEKAKMMGLDYYIPTEHNVLHTGWTDTDVMIVPGVEITTALGHANLFGIDKRPEALDNIIFHKTEELLKENIQAVIKECKERNWLFSVNHPFLYVWKWLMEELKLEDINCLEIINDPTYAADKEAQAEEANRKTVYLSDVLWADGCRICAIGGSDSHKKIDDFYEGAKEPSIPGDPATWIYMDGLSPDHLIDALQKCHSYVTRYCKVECKMNSSDKEVLFGDKLESDAGSVCYEIALTEIEEEPVIFYIQNGIKHICTEMEMCEGAYKVSGEILLGEEEYTWIRFGAEKKDGTFLFYGNPITRGEAEHRFHTFGEVKKYVEEKWESKESYLTKMEH